MKKKEKEEKRKETKRVRDEIESWKKKKKMFCGRLFSLGLFLWSLNRGIN